MSTVLSVDRVADARIWEIDDKFQRIIRDTYRVTMDSALHDIVTVLQLAQIVGPNPLPPIGSSYVGPGGGIDLVTLCKRYRARIQGSESPYKLLVEVEFNSDTADQSQNNDDPLLDNPVCSWGNQQSNRALEYDANGSTLVNSAGDPFDPPIQARTGNLTLTVQTNEAFFDSARAGPASNGGDGLLFSYNGDPIWGYDIGNALLTQFTGQPQRKNNSNFFVVTKVFEFDERYGFQTTKFLDRGMRKKSGGSLVVMTDPQTGAPTTRPLLLDGAGGQLAVGANPSYVSYSLYRAGDWGGLVLPTDPTDPDSDIL